MFRVLYCVRDHHDIVRVLLAAFVCVLACLVAVHLMHRAQKTSDRIQLKWILTAGLSTGFGIWATHFIAMLAYDPGVVTGYDLTLTLISLFMVVAVTTSGIALAVYNRFKGARPLGGAIVGLGIAAMHYMGMMALQLPGRIIWSPDLVIASIVLGVAFGAASLVIALKNAKMSSAIIATLLLVLAIVSHHFTAMGAILIVPDPTKVISGLILKSDTMSMIIALLAIGVMTLCLTMAVMGQRLDTALSHMSQGLCLFDKHEKLVLVNKRYKEIFNLPNKTVREGMSFFEVIEAIFTTRDGVKPDKAFIEAICLNRRQLLATAGGKGSVISEFKDDCILSIAYNRLEDGGFVVTFEDITDWRRNEERMAHMALHDGLTGLPNRDYINQSLDQEIEKAELSNECVVVLAIDIDRFKETNDLHGHEVGDEILKTIATRLKTHLHDGELVARYGGDEFIVAKRYKDYSLLKDLKSRLNSTLNGQLHFNDLDIDIECSIGVAIYPQDARTREVLINNADLALQRAKASFDTSLCFYEAQMDEAARHRRALSKDLWDAIKNEEFCLYYQVQQSVSTGEITGYEALIRWNHPTKGFISPADFIPIAEECGAIMEIGTWVLKTACRQAVTWPGSPKIAVNLSPLQLSNIGLIDLVKETLIETGLSPQRLEIEITESSIIGDKTRALHILRQIKALGVTIAMDDFGTGYSSLDTLNSFPFDKIKIDRSFLMEADTNPQALAIIRAVMALGRSLHIPVLAEGVENEAQLQILRSEGCDEAQGYLLGRPNTLEECQSKANEAGPKIDPLLGKNVA